MAIIYCEKCGQFVDDDYFPCEESKDGDLICPDCKEEEDEQDN